MWNGLKRTKLKPVSDKQKLENEQWKRIRLIKIAQSNTCEWCGGRGQNNELYQLDAHHKISRARGGANTIDNCYLVHRFCHSFIHGNNISVLEYPTRESYFRSKL